MAAKKPEGLGRMLGSSPAIRSVFERIGKAARSDVTVLITGESGTGKELAARAIRDLSPRAKGPFVPVNAGAIPKELTASELFGHEVGAFTGATHRRKGKFELADSGTLFLDEIAATDHATQVALLRALEDGSITRLGGHESIKVDVRFIAATNESLSKAIRDGRFREDLYYRLDVFQIRMPPLRDRATDVLLLAEAFLKQTSWELGRVIDGFEADVVDCLMGHKWPGNVRELRNCIQRAVVAADGKLITRKDLPTRLQKVVGTTQEVRFKLSRNLGDIEKAYVLETLSACSGNKAEAARVLGISRKALYEKLARWGASEVEGENCDGDVYSLGDEETTPIYAPREEEE